MHSHLEHLLEYLFNEEETVEKQMGTCGFCQRQFKVTNRGLLALHGFKRPGLGFHIGSCPGSNKKPLEVSSETLQIGVSIFEKQVEVLTKQINGLPNVTKITLGKKTYNKEKLPLLTWKEIYRAYQKNLNKQLKQSQFALKDFEKNLKNWEPSSLRTITVAQQQQKKQKSQENRYYQKLQKFRDANERTISKLTDLFTKLKRAEDLIKNTSLKEENPQKAAKTLAAIAKFATEIYRIYAEKPSRLIQLHPDKLSREQLYKGWNLQEMFEHMDLMTPTGEYIPQGMAENFETRAFGANYEEFFLKNGLDAWEPFWSGWKR